MDTISQLITGVIVGYLVISVGVAVWFRQAMKRKR